jgi:hypothetical protein
MKLAKTVLPAGASLGDVMRLLSERWKATGPEVDHSEHERYWQDKALEKIGVLTIS